jgi:hypothetical protein
MKMAIATIIKIGDIKISPKIQIRFLRATMNIMLELKYSFILL